MVKSFAFRHALEIASSEGEEIFLGLSDRHFLTIDIINGSRYAYHP
jgi:hypothetical protein